MTPERWQQIDTLFQSAIARGADERAAYLDESCADDMGLRQEVEGLLAAHEKAGSFIKAPAIEIVAEGMADELVHSLAGQIIDRYKTIELLGRGGMGEVYLAQEMKTGRKVALKLLPDYFTRDEQRVRRFQQEARAVLALNHPNIITIYEIGEADGAHFIATEYIDGETLRERMTRVPMKLSEALDVSMQVAGALAEAHAAGVVHRDIKPENIMLRPDGYVKVLDFGIAKLTEPAAASATSGSEGSTRIKVETDPGMIMGTVSYMSPEQARGVSVDARTDVWSLGVVIYEMVAGRVPFEGATLSDVISSILRDEPLPLTSLSHEIAAELELIVAKALRKDMNARYQSIPDLTLDLKDLQHRIEFAAELERSLTPEESKARLEAGGSGGTRGEQGDITSNASRPHPSHNLSAQLSPLIGRAQEVAGIKKMLRHEDARLVTLTGVGGTGKTRLARQVAHEMLAEFDDGVFFIELAAVNDPELVVSSIARPLGVQKSGGASLSDNLKSYLREREILLVLDNFEQLMPAAPLVAELLVSSPKLKALVTSRELLRLSAEHELTVPPLDLPASEESPSADELMEYGAIALFVERARAVKTNFALTDENASAVASVCARLEGLPLAIELAAARIKLLSPQAILRRLENSLKLLTGGAKDLPARQQTMRGTVTWSYDLLDQDEKRLFARLAVFAGGCTLEAAEAVCGAAKDLSIEVLDGVGSLVDKSLLVQKEQGGGESRFRMLEVVREYAMECLRASGEEDAVRRLHAGFFLALGEEAEPELTAARQTEWLERLEEEHDNLRAALRWAREQEDAETGLRLAGAIWRLWWIHGHLTEGRGWLEAALRTGDSSLQARAKALVGIVALTYSQGDYASSRRFGEEGLRISREIGDKWTIARSCNALGIVVANQGDYKAARALYEESLALCRELGNRKGVSIALNNLGEVAELEGDYSTARSLFEEFLAEAKQSGDKREMTAGVLNVGEAAFYQGDYAQARSSYQEGLTVAQELGEKRFVANAFDGLAALAAKRGEAERAARLFGAATRLRETIGSEMGASERDFRDAYVSELRDNLGGQAFAAAVAEGRALRTKQAIAIAIGSATAQ